MKAIEAKFGDADLLVEIIDVENIPDQFIQFLEHNSNDMSSSCKKRKTVLTSNVAEDKKKSLGVLNEVSNNLQLIIKNIASSIANTINEVNPKPSQLDLEFSLSLSNKASMWILTGESNSTIKIKLQWK